MFHFRFDPFEADPAAGQLRKHGIKLRLSGQPLEILIMLLERPGIVVTREEIQQRLWSTETFVDFENSLNKAINKLRSALSDSPDRPTYIETLPRRGYRFLAPVQRVELQPNPVATVRAETPAPSLDSATSLRSPVLWISPRSLAYSSVALLLLALVWFFFRPQPVPHVLKLTLLTSSSRADMFGRLHTDGVRLFFLERHGDHWQLSQMPASGGAIQPFSTPLPNAKILDISPDASEFLLASFTERGRNLALWLMPSVGGTPRRLGDIMATDAVYTPDGSQITFATDEGIFQVSRDALNQRKLLDASGPKDGLSWSPDGELRFGWATAPQAGATIWSLRPGLQTVQQLLPGWTEAISQCCGRFTRDGRYYLFLGFSIDGSRGVYALRETHGIFTRRPLPHRLDTGSLNIDEPIPSPDGHRLYALATNARTEYVRFDPARRDFRALLGGDNAAWLNVSPAGDWVVFRGADNNLWISKSNGSERRQLTAGSLSPEMPAFSPDGNQVVFGATPPDTHLTKICVVSAAGGPIHDVVSESFSVYSPSWSHDRSNLLYAADPDDPAHTGLFLFDWATKQKLKVPGSEGFWKSRLSPDGKFIASVTADNKTISLFDFATQRWAVVTRGRVFSPVAWSPDSQYIYFQDLLEDNEPIHRYNLATRKTDLAMECRPILEGGVLRCGFEDALPDGSFLLQLTRGDHDVYSLDLDLP